MLKIKETWLISISNGVLLLVASGSMGQMVAMVFYSGLSEIGQAVKLMTIVGISSAIGSWAFGNRLSIWSKNALLLAIAVTVAHVDYIPLINMLQWLLVQVELVWD